MHHVCVYLFLEFIIYKKIIKNIVVNCGDKEKIKDKVF